MAGNDSSNLRDDGESAALSLVAEVRRLVEARLEEHLASALGEATAAGRHAVAMVDGLASLVRRGGKRLRPALGWAAHVACGGDPRADERALIEIGCAWELLQAYLLIHDDWMDGDETRRGGPSVHVMLRDHHQGDAKLGDASAVLAGDLGCTMAHRVLLDAPLPATTLLAVARAFEGVHGEVVLGQSIDLALGSEDDGAVERMHVLKTASYSVRGPVRLGAIVAGANARTLAGLDRWATAIGVAFQLRDDVLGVFGAEDKTGKPVGSDLRNGRRTAVTLAAERASDEAARARLASLTRLGGGELEAELRWALEHCERVGARAAVEARIATLVAEARAALADGPLTSDGVRLLGGFASLLVDRSA
jgi:geranylgeranyl diphosphate synthase type I